MIAEIIAAMRARGYHAAAAAFDAQEMTARQASYVWRVWRGVSRVIL